MRVHHFLTLSIYLGNWLHTRFSLTCFCSHKRVFSLVNVNYAVQCTSTQMPQKNPFRYQKISVVRTWHAKRETHIPKRVRGPLAHTRERDDKKINFNVVVTAVAAPQMECPASQQQKFDYLFGLIGAEPNKRRQCRWRRRRRSSRWTKQSAFGVFACRSGPYEYGLIIIFVIATRAGHIVYHASCIWFANALACAHVLKP